MLAYKEAMSLLSAAILGVVIVLSAGFIADKIARRPVQWTANARCAALTLIIGLAVVAVLG